MNFTEYLSHQYSVAVWPSSSSSSTQFVAPSPIYTPPASVSSPPLFCDDLDEMYSFNQNSTSNQLGYPSPLFSPMTSIENDDNTQVHGQVQYQPTQSAPSLFFPLPNTGKDFEHQPHMYHPSVAMQQQHIPSNLAYQYNPSPLEPAVTTQSEIFFNPSYQPYSVPLQQSAEHVPLNEEKPQVAPTKTSKRKSLTCQYEGCNKTFTRHYNLVSHMRTHTSERPFICPDPSCGKAFARPHDRNRHAKLHLGIKPHVCTNCRKRFARADALSRHLKVKNGCSQRYD